ncbi:MAG: hypothetical protein QMD05_03660 [Candidatus Brocadiaceae bacterium]|nr:hypothetical protein [Candidatus Brocadiaceae bacterium]
MEVEVARPLPQKKDSSSQEVLGTPPLPPQGLDEAIQQTSSFVPLKEFQKQGIKNLKVISQRGLEELINQAVEWELARRLDKERESHMALEGEVSRLRKELETLKRAGGKATAIDDEQSDVSNQQSGGQEQIAEGRGPKTTSDGATPLSPSSPKANITRGFFGNILKENLNLRGVNQKTSGA